MAADWSGPSIVAGAFDFHQSLSGYAPTPLVALPELARELGVGEVLVKDESSRLGLPAFKILGASWACQQVIARQPGAMFVAATDGNHGRAVARMAGHFGVAATVFVPRVMLPRTAALIADEGAEVIWVHGDYDEAVRRAADFAGADDGRALVQDTAWPGYEQVPAWIVEGYQTMLAEVDSQLGVAPDLVVVPVGVGSLAEAVVRHYRGPDGPRSRVLAVEPDTAACLLASLTAAPTDDGDHCADGDGRAELRNRVGLGLAGAVRRLRCRRRGDRRGRPACGRRPGPDGNVLRAVRGSHVGRRSRRLRCGGAVRTSRGSPPRQ